MIKKNRINYFLTTFLLFFSFFSVSFAKQSDVSLSLEPKNPTPFTPVTATLISYLINVNTAFVIWTVDGKEVLRGLGEKKLTIKTGEVGSFVSVHAKVETANNQVYDIDIDITPESVDLLYETPESYVPLFYEGKSLPGEGALVKFVAMPNINENGVTLPPSSLSYFWYINDEFVDDASGINKQAAFFELDFLRSYTTIKVIVKGPRGTSAEKYIDIYPHEVMPMFYQYNEILGGNYSKTISTRFEATKDFTLLLEPFFLSTNVEGDDPSVFIWSIDDLPVTPLGGRLLSLHPKENSYGSKQLSVSIKNTKRRLQKVVTDLNLVFDTR